MKRRTLLQGLALLPTLPLLGGYASSSLAEAVAITPLEKPHEQWRGLVSDEAYAVLFDEDTERAGSSPLNREKRDGTYICAACYLPLFESAHKYESGTGWPSFTQPIDGHMGTKRDFKLILPRTEYHCARCGGHQGHVFNDGPKPRGERWCNNGLALRFIPQGETLPELRS
ncbi:MAG: peptide-methionine (R)-S-oxide reductase MsrB [Gammaproteobacteria bacterium]|nr:peptide-methionine (R)-S-oxide reductase MsrB [Gammaproteobacteria bacterium]MBU1488464.1 peptide-methionine (R)-S-oxide reductase MsrB [Gammaproteobacteria bacterium]MBU2067055.1 peptide-methionine (R)-S-oxide reductase MsrB [Gammaproteobacteria bacterium]MBU2138112.1 peptide-methionine (R)-S-oxide reductase MsrB [Gammaproteobacteria bacterium]MBU2216089.1 peptide-methionine (R)-S-oxide reductase MsrB [Gammaproteobacteria bacterium]